MKFPFSKFCFLTLSAVSFKKYFLTRILQCDRKVSMIRLVLQFFVILSSFAVISCQTVTIRPDGGGNRYSGFQSYEASQNFFFWGLVGEAHINVASICGEREVKQMQTQATFVNKLLYFITLGIYSPRTARVWCGKQKVEEKVTVEETEAK